MGGKEEKDGKKKERKENRERRRDGGRERRELEIQVMWASGKGQSCPQPTLSLGSAFFFTSLAVVHVPLA